MVASGNFTSAYADLVSIPTEKEIRFKLAMHFASTLSEKKLDKLAIHIYNEFIALNGQPYSGAAKETPIKPAFVINSYPDYKTLSEKEAILGVISPLSMHDFRGFHITVVHAIKRVQLAYVAK